MERPRDPEPQGHSDAGGETRARLCASCGEPSAGGAFCEHCGAAMAPEAPGERPRRGAERSRAAFELNRASKILAGVRGLFWLCAIFGLVVLLLSLAASRVGDEDEEAGSPWLTAALGALMAAVGVAGALRATREPLVWGLTLAALVTVELALRLVLGATPLQYAASGVFALFAWSSVPMLAKAQRLMREHADLRIAQQMRGTFERRAVEQSEIRGRMRERDAARRRRLLGRLAIGLGVVAAAVVVVVVVATRPREAGIALRSGSRDPEKKPPPVPVEPSVAAFEAGWNGNDAAALAALYAPDERDKAWASTKRFLERRGWGQQLPRLGKAVLDRKAPDKVLAVYEVEGHELRVWWRGDERGWRLGSFAYEK